MGPLCDERVCRLINRRFVPIYFDTEEIGKKCTGPGADEDANKFVQAKHKIFNKSGGSWSDVLLMTPKGELVGKVHRFASSSDVFKALVKARKDHPDFDRPGPLEKNIDDSIQQAQLLIDLGDNDGAQKILEKQETGNDKANYLLGRLARWQNNAKLMETHFAKIKKPAFADDMRMERAYPLWWKKDYEALRDHLKDFSKESARYNESQYYLGLAYYHLKEKEKAIKTWKSMIENMPNDRWAYKADWAYTHVVEPLPRWGFSVVDGAKRTSPVGRAGYLRTNPDLKGPRKN